MPDLPKTVVRLATELLKHQAKNLIGDEALNIIAKSMIDYAGENVTEKITSYFNNEDNAENLLAAFKDADASFLSECEDNTLRQMVISKPLADLPSLENLASKLSKTLDDQGLHAALYNHFVEDWPNLSTAQINRAAKLYKKCLDRALAAKCDQMLPAIFRKLDHIEDTTNATREIVNEIKEKVDALSPRPKFSSLSFLFTIPEPPKDFRGRTDEIDELLVNFQRGVSISGLTGGGGVGKTALARLLAQRLADQFPDARLEIDLQGAPRLGQIPLKPVDAMRRLLQPFYPDQKLPDDEADIQNLYVGTFSQRHALMLLDNVRDAAQVRPLLPPTPSAALVTSRTDLSGLSANGVYAKKLGMLPPNDARALLSAASPRLQNVADKEIDSIARLCGFLPLALRVAGALLQQRPDWTSKTLFERLSDERKRLTSLKLPDDPDLDVEASLALSYTLLSDDMKRRLRMLGVFPASFNLNAVSAVWDDRGSL